jgi:RNA polymerase sigma-70 factor (ECF subfamily)
MNGTTEPPVVSGFGHLVEQEILPLQRYARALTRDRDRADDLVQTCLTRALARQHLWQPGTALRAWLFTILHNAWVSLLRSAAREQARREITVALLTPAARQPDARLDLIDLDRAISKLPTYQRRILVLIALEGMSYPQAAAAVGARVGTVRSRMGRARGRLRAQLSRPAAAAKRCDCNSAVAPV